MPELPEVETIKSGLETLIKINDPIEKLEPYRPDLRFTIPKFRKYPKRILVLSELNGELNIYYLNCNKGSF